MLALSDVFKFSAKDITPWRSPFFCMISGREANPYYASLYGKFTSEHCLHYGAVVDQRFTTCFSFLPFAYL